MTASLSKDQQTTETVEMKHAQQRHNSTLADSQVGNNSGGMRIKQQLTDQEESKQTQWSNSHALTDSQEGGYSSYRVSESGKVGLIHLGSCGRCMSCFLFADNL